MKIKNIEIAFPATVELPEHWEHRLVQLVDEVCKKYEAEHPGRVMWPFGTGYKMLSNPLMVADDEPLLFDESTFSIDVHERQDYEYIKVFRLNDSDWVAGPTLESCIELYLRETGSPRDEAIDEPRQLTSEEMETLKHYGDDWDREEPITFRQELDRLIADGAEFPRFFASTEQ